MSSWLEDRRTALQARIEALENAMLQVSSGAVTSYEIDTGQSKQRVTKENIKDMQAILDGMYNQYAVMTARLTGCGVQRSVAGGC